jgi:hypothetical protein
MSVVGSRDRFVSGILCVEIERGADMRCPLAQIEWLQSSCPEEKVAGESAKVRHHGGRR